jgi:hypothetical protein
VEILSSSIPCGKREKKPGPLREERRGEERQRAALFSLIIIGTRKYKQEKYWFQESRRMEEN